MKAKFIALVRAAAASSRVKVMSDEEIMCLNYADLEFDSLDTLDFFMSIDDCFGCEIPTEKLINFTQISDIYDYICKSIES